MYLAVIPAFNEDNSIANIVQETKKYVDQVIVVDDSSRDNTRELARRSGAIVLHHSKNRGVGAAMITGIAYAQKLKPDIVVTLDADGQHKPEDIPRLIQHPPAYTPHYKWGRIGFLVLVSCKSHQQTFRKLRVEYPCEVENFFLVKAWSKRK